MIEVRQCGAQFIFFGENFMTNAKRQTRANSLDDEEGEGAGSSSQHQDPVADDDENTWRAGEVEGASDYLGRRPTMRLDCAVRKRCSR